MTLISRLLSAVLAITLAACGPAASPPAAARVAQEDHPALWKLADEDTTIYLFGTIHVLPAGYEWRDAAIDAAIDRSDALVIEAVIDRTDPAKAFALLSRLGTTPGLPPLLDRVPADKREQLAALIARSRLPQPFLDGMETWSGALMLMPVLMSDLGLDGGMGVEEQLEARFKADGRPIEGLETAEQQLRVLDGLPEDVQRQFLVAMIDDGTAQKAEFDAMLAAWSRGDEAAIAATFDKDVRVSPELRAALLVRRNAAWADWLKARLDRPGTIFVAVGAGHLAGPDSVVRMLEAKGLKVERVQ
ncbi:GumN family protein [Sphingomonas sp. MM-1]|uniref:TraB/GumN family protein n=1 Tax=Sphingomonas sp. MM-1 TaxID=745310 RepID=UPI0002C0752D|nr:TraB/GumN family protein [Sphingomonas sp. MM-1]AGH49230.1 GumN family protein [Sphingomonas sp. MM-1]